MCYQYQVSLYVPSSLKLRPQPRSWHSLAHCSPAVSRCFRRDHRAWRYRARWNSPAEEIWVAPRRQSFDAAAGDRDARTSRLSIQGTRDFNHSCSGRMCNKPRWHTAEADAMSPSSLWNSFNELSCLVWSGAGKTKWPPRALTRGGLSSPWSLNTPPDMLLTWLGVRMLFCMLTHSPRDSKWNIYGW